MRRDGSVRRLTAGIRRRANLVVRGWAVCVLAWTAGCSVDNRVGASTDAPGGIGSPEGGPASASDTPPILVLPELRNTDGGLCPAFTCSTGTTQYCGDIGDSCGQPQHCGACPTGTSGRRAGLETARLQFSPPGAVRDQQPAGQPLPHQAHAATSLRANATARPALSL